MVGEPTFKQLYFTFHRKIAFTLAALLLSLAPSSIAAPTLQTFHYDVEYGDSLNGIAARNHITPDSIRFLKSPPNPYPLPGTVVVLSVQSPLKSPETKTYSTLCSHRVQYGETIFSIARRYGIDPYYLARINWLYDANYIYAGQILRVPCRPAPPPQTCGSPVWVRVAPGDNLFRIALRYGTTIYSIAIANRIPNPNFIRSGDNLFIPCPGKVSTTYRPVTSASPTAAAQTLPSPTATLPTPLDQLVKSPTPTNTVTQSSPIPLLPIATSTPAPRATATGTVNPYIATALPATITVTMKNLQFQPASLQVTANTTVTWMNTETTNTQHFIVSGSCVNNVCTPTNQFASDILAPGQSFSLRFTYIGTYSYYCVIHGSRMTGTIMVTP